MQPPRKVKCGSNIETNKSTSYGEKTNDQTKESDVPINVDTTHELFSIAINKVGLKSAIKNFYVNDRTKLSFGNA